MTSPYGPIPLTLFLLGVVWLGSAYQPLEGAMLLLLLVILVGLVLHAYPTFKSNLNLAFGNNTATTPGGGGGFGSNSAGGGF